MIPNTTYEETFVTERRRAVADIEYMLNANKYYTQQKLYLQLIDFLYRIGYYEDNESYFLKER